MVETLSPGFLSRILSARTEIARTEAAQHVSAELERAALNEGQALSQDELKQKFHLVLPVIQRLSFSCPFDSIRTHFRTLEVALIKHGLLSNPDVPHCVSRFLPAYAFPDIAKCPAAILHFFQDSFLLQGRVSHLDQVIAIQPGRKFSLSYFSTYSSIMHEDGPLPHHFRNFLAIQAAARFQCGYLIKLQECEFILNGGDPAWLANPESAPDKLRLFLHLNALMAHLPWKISRSTFRHLLNDKILSVSEVVHGIIVLSTFHSLCGLCFGLGIVDEPDLPPSPSDPNSLSHNSTSSEQGSDQLSHRVSMSPVSAEATHNLTILLKTSINELIATTQWANGDPFVEMDSVGHNDELSQSNVAGGISALASSVYARYLGNVALDLQYADYNVKSDEHKVFRMGDFDWKDHGYSLVSRYWHELGAQQLDEEWDIIYNLTDRSVSEEMREIDTGPFRRAIWNYTFRLFGVSNDEYNYQEVNIFLNRPLKLFLKKLVCFSDRITSHDFANLGYSLRPDEVVHVALLGVEARRQAALLYALRELYNELN